MAQSWLTDMSRRGRNGNIVYHMKKKLRDQPRFTPFFSEKSAMFQRWPNIDKGRENETVRYLSPSSKANLLLDSGFG